MNTTTTNTVSDIGRVVAVINEMNEALSSALTEQGDRITDALAKATASVARAIEIAERNREIASRKTYTYTDKHGETFTGTLEDIGERLIESYTLEIACMDNPEPWHTLDDFGTTHPRRFTLDEWIEWTATCEDRTRREVENALTEAA